MIRTEPQVNERAKYSVCEAARVMQCSRATLWRYATYFHVVPSINKLNCRSYFTGQQLLQIWRCAY